MSAADQARAAINLRTLQRIDKSIQSIVDWAGYVVLYLHANGKWTKEGIEGSMFLYERDSAPHYGLLILNRNGKQNYIQAISSATEVEVQDRMINLDEGAGGDQTGIVGLWCSNGPEEAQQMAARIRSLAQRANQHSNPTSIDLPAAHTQDPTLTMSDLMSRLSAGHGGKAPAARQQGSPSTATMPTPDLASGNSASTSTMMLKQMLGLSAPATTDTQRSTTSSSSPDSSPRVTPSATAAAPGRSVFDSPQQPTKAAVSRRRELVKASMDDSDDVAQDSSTPRRSSARRAAEATPSSRKREQPKHGKKMGRHTLVEDSTTQDEGGGGESEEQMAPVPPPASGLRTPALKTARQRGKNKTRREVADGDDAATPVKQGKQAPAERRAGGDQGKAKANAVAAAQPIRLADRGYIPSPTRNGDAYARALDPGKLQAAILGGMSSATNAPAAAKERRPAAKALVEEDQDTDADEEEHSRHVQNRGTDDEPIGPDKESASKEREDKREFVKALLHQIHTNQAFVDDLWDAYRSS